LPQQLPAAFAVGVAPTTRGIAGLTILETAVERRPAVADLVVVIVLPDDIGLSLNAPDPSGDDDVPRS
jgi:hypothetical protein